MIVVRLSQKNCFWEPNYLSGTINTTLYAAAAYDNKEAMLIQAATIPMVTFQASGIRGSCHGLLYFADQYTGGIVVSNPLRSQFTILPPIPIKKYYSWDSCWTAMGLGFHSSTKTFKMVCPSKKQESSHFTIVHTLGTTSWREVPSVSTYYCGRIDDQSVYVHGFLHWMIDHLQIKNQGRILAFDVSKETFEVVPHPKLSFEKHSDRHFRILDFKGNLGMFDLSHGTKFDLWVMDYEKKSWSKEYTVDITIVGKIYVDATEVKGLWKQDEILFSFFQHFLHQDNSRRDIVRYWSYSMRTGNIKECEDQSSKARVYSLKGSLISVPGAMEVS